MTTQEMRGAVKLRGAYPDGCIFNPAGIVCKDTHIDCAHCGWCPAETKRRLLDLHARNGDGEAEE